MAITVQGQTSGDTNATAQTTGSSYTLIYDPATDGYADAIEIVNDDSSASNSIIIKAERWAAKDGAPREYELFGGEAKCVRGRGTVDGAPNILGKIWLKTGSAGCEVRWGPI